MVEIGDPKFGVTRLSCLRSEFLHPLVIVIHSPLHTKYLVFEFDNTTDCKEGMRTRKGDLPHAITSCRGAALQ